MKRLTNAAKIILFFGLIVYCTIPVSRPVQSQAQNAAGMPGWTLPAKPIPHHQPGQPSRAGNAAAQVTRMSADGSAETVQLTGMDALLADGTLTDPLLGNYTVVKKQEILFGGYGYGSTNQFTASTLSYQDPPAVTLLSSQNFGDNLYSKVAAGDLNGDLVDEQIVAWLDPATLHYMMSIGKFSNGEDDADGRQTTSAPAAAAYADGDVDVVVRGYDHALWHIHADGAAWGRWDNAAGGMLLSGPAAASRVVGQMDVLGVGFDNQLYHTLWDGSAWAAWAPLPGGGIFPQVSASLPLQDVFSPAVAARNANTLDVFRVAQDHSLYWVSSSDGGASWGEWTSLGGMLASAPAAVALDADHMLVGAVGADGAFWFRLYNGSGWDGWQWLEVPAGVAANTLPSLASPNAGQAVLFLPGPENHLWSSSYSGSAWGGWSDTPLINVDHNPTLGAGVGAAGYGGLVHVFAQAADGWLYTPGSFGAWDRMARLPETIIVDTGLTSSTNNCGDGDLIGQCFFDVTTGYFSGDGRQQIALAYVENLAGNQTRLALFDIRDGFRLEQVASLVDPISPAVYPRVAAGDVNGDGLDEIGLAYEAPIYHCSLAVYQVDKTPTGGWAGSLTQLGDTKTWSETYESDPSWFAGTLIVAAGDIIPEGEGEAINDEFAILSDWALSQYYEDYSWNVVLHIYDGHPAGADFKRYLRFASESDDDNFWDRGLATGAALAIGDLNGPQSGYGLDEVVVTWPGAFDGDDWPDVYRDIYIFSYDVAAVNLHQVGYRDLPGYSRYSFLDALAIGDLDMDLHNEIVFAGHTGNANGAAGYNLFIYEAAVDAGGDVTLSDPVIQPIPYSGVPRNFSLALGDFTGKSLKVGPPTYRVQNKMTTPVILLNMPPLHKDIVNVGGTNTLVQAVSSAYAEFKTSNTQDTKYSSTSMREWSLSTGFETSVGGGGFKVTASFDNTYGENFTHVTQQFTSVNISASYKADVTDKIIHNETNYAIWEYPVYGLVDGDASVPRTISVIWPLVDLPGETNLPASTTSNLCDENFYVPGHQVYNAWSYDEEGTVRFKDLKTGITSEHISGGGDDITFTMTGRTEEERTYSYNNQISAGLEFSYENELNIPLVGNAWDFSFRAYAKGHYASESIQTFESVLSDQLSVYMNYPSPSTGVLPAITAYLYWSQADYLVLDYQTHPDMGSTFWSVYDKPDPAFILPWYGFPDLDGTQHPTCTGKQTFTHDIQVAPNYAENGQEVTLTATVRNFSSVTIPNDFTVQFYWDDPALNHPIGSCQISAFNRAQGPMQCSTTWTVDGVSGAGRVYAVIDAADAVLDEMHQQGDLINNNVGYGLLNVAGADTFDPGLKDEEVYQAVPFLEAPGLSFDLYLPTNNLTEAENPDGSFSYIPNTIRVDLIPAANVMTGSVGKLFTIGAFLNDIPQIQYTFQPAPAGVMMQYRDSDLLPGMNESNLTLYRQEGQLWVEATCPGYEIARFLAENRLAVPICQIGTFVLSDQQIATNRSIYLPILSK